MGLTMLYIKENIVTNIKKAHYFSDGCAGQYKNCKMLSICACTNLISLRTVFGHFLPPAMENPLVMGLEER